MRDTNSAARAESRGYESIEKEPPTLSLGDYSQGNRRTITAEIQARVGFKQLKGTGCEGNEKRDESLKAYLEKER